MDIIVQKYGGSSVADTEKIKISCLIPEDYREKSIEKLTEEFGL